MPKQFIKRLSLNRSEIHKHRYLRVFGVLLHDANLLHINRRSCAGAFAIGLFVAFVPLPVQMILSAGLAILFRVNLPLSMALVWVTNPVTIPPMFFCAYAVGTWFLGEPPTMSEFEFSVDWFRNGGLESIWAPFLLGSLISGLVSSAIGYTVIRWLWRLQAIRQWERRKQQRIAKRNLTHQ